MKNRTFIILYFLSIFIFMSLVFTQMGSAAKTGADKEELAAIREKLTAIEQKVDELIEGQKKLSEEHTQLRYWIHRK
jgi:hypothetical protein